jgi:hypothetical protein
VENPAARQRQAREIRFLLVGDDAGMSWLALHPQEIADRVKRTGLTKPGFTLLESIAVGAIGFMFVSVAGFAPWAFAGKALHHASC